MRVVGQGVAAGLIACITFLGLGIETRADQHGTGIETLSGAIEIRQHRSRVLNVPGVTHVAVGDGDILQVRVVDESDDVLLIGLRPGVTDVRIWRRNRAAHNYRITVRPGEAIDPARPSADELRALIGLDIGDPEIVVIEAADSLNLIGRARSSAELARVEALSGRFASVHSYVEPASIEQQDTVFIEAQFVEISERGLREFGFDWDPVVSGPVFAFAGDHTTNNLFRAEFSGLTGVDQDAWPLDIGSSNTHIGWGFGLESLLRLLVESGNARVLAEPVLSALSGEEADFLSGGEIPIPVREDGEVRTEFREFGIRLQVRPTTNQRREIRTAVEVEVSDVDFAQQVLGIPAIVSSRATTVMHAPSGQSLVIAGLISEEASKAVRKIPLLGDLPILGELFKSRRFEGERSELIVIVTPHIADHDSRINRELIQRYGDALDRGGRSTRFRIMD